jgi:polyisoprenoid-binding protein YceI
MTQPDHGTSDQLSSAALAARLREGTLAGTWTLDPARSQVLLTTRHTWGLRPLHGVFHQVAGGGTVTPDGDVTGVITVAARSIDTKNPIRDNHLRSAEFFDAASHPDVTVSVDAVSPEGDGVRVTGTLTIRDISRPVTLDATVSIAADEVRLDGDLQVDRRDFGMMWNRLGIASMHNTITVHAVFSRR